MTTAFTKAVNHSNTEGKERNVGALVSHSWSNPTVRFRGVASLPAPCWSYLLVVLTSSVGGPSMPTTGPILTSFPILADGPGESEARSSISGAWEISHVPHNVIHLLNTFFLYNLIRHGARTLLTSTLATEDYFFESFLHFYSLILQGDTFRTFLSSDWSDNERVLLSLADQIKTLKS